MIKKTILDLIDGLDELSNKDIKEKLNSLIAMIEIDTTISEADNIKEGQVNNLDDAVIMNSCCFGSGCVSNCDLASDAKLAKDMTN